MSVVTIPNQLVAFNFPVSDCDSCDQREYCSPVPVGDTVDFQFKQTPCGPNLNCDPAFNYKSENLVLNPNFSAVANWVLGASWAYGVNMATYTAGGADTLYQTLAAFTANKNLVVRFTITGYAGAANGITVTLGSLNLTTISANGTYALTVDSSSLGAGTDIIFSPTGATAFNVTDAEVYELVPCWLGASGWDFNPDGSVDHVSGTTSLTMGSTPVVPGSYYYVVVTIYNYVSGSVRVVCGSTQSSAINQEGSTIVYITANGTGFSLLPTADFVGTITYLTIKKLKNDYTFGVLDMSTDIEYTTPSIGNYYLDYVTVKLNPTLYLPSGSKCFKVVIHDVCDEYGDNLVAPNPDILTTWVTRNNWYQGFYSLYAVANINSTLIGYIYPDTAYRAGTDYPLVTSYAYRVRLTGTVNATSYFQMAISGHLFFPGGKITAPGTYTGITVTGVNVHNQIVAFLKGDAGAAATDLVNLWEIEIYPIINVDRIFTSQCFQIYSNDDCIREIKAICDKPAFGFMFDVPTALSPTLKFYLRSWVALELFDPIFPEEQTNYIYSNGEKKITFASSQEWIQLRTDFVPEWVHRTLRIMKICDHFYVKSIEYVCNEGDYAPEYLEGENLRLSSVELTLRPKIILLQNNNCE